MYGDSIRKQTFILLELILQLLNTHESAKFLTGKKNYYLEKEIGENVHMTDKPALPVTAASDLLLEVFP